MGTSNAGQLLKGAKKVRRARLFFIGQNGTALSCGQAVPEGNGKFLFGPGRGDRFAPDLPSPEGRVDANEMSGGVG